MNICEIWPAHCGPADDVLAASGGAGPGDEDDDDEDGPGGGSGGNIDPDDDEGYDEDEDEDDDEEPLRCAAPIPGSAFSLRRSNTWYHPSVRRSASL
jgi:hypothetical protein